MSLLSVPFNRFQEALDVQDACNMRAVARLLVAVCDDAMIYHQNTSAVWSDPAVRLVVNKLESLSRSEDNFGDAYAQCRRHAHNGAAGRMVLDDGLLP